MRYKTVEPRDGGKRATIKIAQRLNRSSGLLAASVLLDSAVEHYRGDFKNPAMITPIATPLITRHVSVEFSASGGRKKLNNRSPPSRTTRSPRGKSLAMAGARTSSPPV